MKGASAPFFILAHVNTIATFRTMAQRSEGIYKEKGSKFIGIAQQCFSEEEAKGLLESWRKEHHQARHLCYAYRFGADRKVYRANDDGEPGNSAGPPILGQIEAFDLSNVLIGVVRYYGGTKLGVGGLIAAYRTAAKEAVLAGTIEEREIHEWIEVTFTYEDLPHVMNFLKKNNLEMIDNDFEVQCKLTTKLKLNTAESIKEELKHFKTLKLTIKGIY